ncbi:MAG TPA: phosphoribosylanthranilate isomerase [Chitinophagaceae bacterium]
MRTRVKICCISSVEEAKLAIHAGADALGLVGKMPSGPGPIEDDCIAAIAKTIHPPVSSFLLTSEQSATGIINHLNRTHVSTVQIVDELMEGTYRQIRDALPHLRIVQVIHVTGEESIEQAVKIQELADTILLDSGDPGAAIKILGGTGNIHNWSISRKIVELVPIPVFLAGGLNHNNVAEAINIVQPFGVDICSGVRTEGRLDPGKLKSFMLAVNNVQNSYFGNFSG